jgi:hypothetical protein
MLDSSVIYGEITVRRLHMPGRPGKVPSYCLHKRSGRAVVRIDGGDHYLGPYGSAESHEHYERLIAEWGASRVVQAEELALSTTAAAKVTINQILLAYAAFARRYYTKDGRATSELCCMQTALRPLRELFGGTKAADFGPKALKTVREKMIADDVCRGVINSRVVGKYIRLLDAEKDDVCRGVINSRVSRIKRFFRWAVAEELIPPLVYHGLQTVRGLSFGRSSARETEPIRPIADVWVEATMPSPSTQVAAMVELQRVTGMRPCKVV